MSDARSIGAEFGKFPKLDKISRINSLIPAADFDYGGRCTAEFRLG
jgi:hypothetical protein